MKMMQINKDKVFKYEIEGIEVYIQQSTTGWNSSGFEYIWAIEDPNEKRTLWTGEFSTLEETLLNVKEHIRLYGRYKNIKIYTSYFDKVQYLKDIGYTNFVSIVGNTPPDFTGRKYLDLAPKYDWWKEWKDNNYSNEWYKEMYYKTVLNKLDPVKVRKELGDKAILLCYEKPGEFCHRRLVAEWLEQKLGNKVEEYF